MTLLQGVVERYIESKRFGFVRTDDNRTALFHMNQCCVVSRKNSQELQLHPYLKKGGRTPHSGDRVVFYLKKTKKGISLSGWGFVDEIEEVTVQQRQYGEVRRTRRIRADERTRAKESLLQFHSAFSGRE